MTVSRRSRKLTTAPQEVWGLVSDPHHFPRWWPGVTRVEAVDADHFTQVFKTRKGRPVRLDFQIIASEPPWSQSWEQEVTGTPFERVLNRSVISVELKPADGGTEVILSHEQRLRGYSRTGGFMLRRATKGKLDEALEGLARICH